MALIECPDCGKEVSESATICAGCGKPMHTSGLGRATSAWKSTALIGIAAVGIGALIRRIDPQDANIGLVVFIAGAVLSIGALLKLWWHRA